MTHLKIEEKVKEKLLRRGFSEKTILNNRGLISATVNDTILSVLIAVTD